MKKWLNGNTKTADWEQTARELQARIEFLQQRLLLCAIALVQHNDQIKRINRELGLPTIPMTNDTRDN